VKFVCDDANGSDDSKEFSFVLPTSSGDRVRWSMSRRTGLRIENISSLQHQGSQKYITTDGCAYVYVTYELSEQDPKPSPPTHQAASVPKEKPLAAKHTPSVVDNDALKQEVNKLLFDKQDVSCKERWFPESSARREYFELELPFELHSTIDLACVCRNASQLTNQNGEVRIKAISFWPDRIVFEYV
jgi:hypothetical protein